MAGGHSKRHGQEREERNRSSSRSHSRSRSRHKSDADPHGQSSSHAGSSQLQGSSSQAPWGVGHSSAARTIISRFPSKSALISQNQDGRTPGHLLSDATRKYGSNGAHEIYRRVHEAISGKYKPYISKEIQRAGNKDNIGYAALWAAVERHLQDERIIRSQGQSTGVINIPGSSSISAQYTASLLMLVRQGETIPTQTRALRRGSGHRCRTHRRHHPAWAQSGNLSRARSRHGRALPAAVAKMARGRARVTARAREDSRHRCMPRRLARTGRDRGSGLLKWTCAPLTQMVSLLESEEQTIPQNGAEWSVGGKKALQRSIFAAR